MVLYLFPADGNISDGEERSARAKKEQKKKTKLVNAELKAALAADNLEMLIAAVNKVETQGCVCVVQTIVPIHF